ncbi:potassium channel subfamily K member 16-like [Octopus vulgaris]|uniref:Potassium channel subfamily K member 16-like n=1 Tax=Octopus vulgaris TaxID=6645 RepID=A0AA36B8A1_OCTVU|nr:potassium channel subfamily K member 16-like [Octopus vulgaris]
MECKYLALLVLAVVAYLCIGAAIFQEIEEDEEINERTKIRNEIKYFTANHTCLDKERLASFLDVIASDPLYAYNVIQGNSQVTNRWTFSGSFCFVVTTVTTIGYGVMAPVTDIGKIVVIIYALIGIPLTLVMLGHIGDKLKDVANRINNLSLFSRKPIINKAANMAIIIILGLTLLFVAPALIFRAVEKWTILDAIYFCFITLSTIGFGDYVVGIGEKSENDEASTNVYRIVTYAWIVIGLAYIALIINYISSTLAKKGQQVQKHVKRLESSMENLHREKTLSKSEKSENTEIPMSPEDKKSMQENGVTLVKFLPSRDFKVEPIN